MRRFAVGILLALILPLSACTVYEGDYGYEPYYGRPYPPPSYGDWRWDDDLRVYVSVGYPYVYYHDHTYYRWYDNHWSSGPGFRGPWRMVEHRHVPARLGQRYYPRQYHDGRRDNDRYDYRQPRYDDRDRRDYRDHRDRQDHRDYRDWQHRQDMDRRDQRLERRDERFGQRLEDRQRRQLQQFNERERAREQQRINSGREPGRDPRQWQQRHDDRRMQPGMPINRQQMQGNERRYERNFEQPQRRALSGPSRREQGNRPVSGQGQGQEQGDGRGQGHGQGRGAGGMQWGNQR